MAWADLNPPGLPVELPEFSLPGDKGHPDVLDPHIRLRELRSIVIDGLGDDDIEVDHGKCRKQTEGRDPRAEENEPFFLYFH
ncbi:MAG: hypothetical protein IPI28_19200 [Candidatus Omnitrophica bacterium]|nr:hypothetical protein [Candidatus Omnitrophota bacterium]